MCRTSIRGEAGEDWWAARIPGQRLKRVLWLISTLEKPRLRASRRREAPSVVRSACQQVDRARLGKDIEEGVSRKEG